MLHQVRDMPNRKNPPHVLTALICLVLVLGLSGSCKFLSSKHIGTELKAKFLLWIITGGPNDSVITTGIDGGDKKELAVPGQPGAVARILTWAGGNNSSLRLGLAAAGTDASAEPAVDVAAEEPRLIFAGRTTAQILNLGTNTLGAQAQLTGQFATSVAVSGDDAFAAVMVGRLTGGPGEVDYSVDLIDLGSMTRTATIALPTECDARGIAFLPGTDDFALACSGDGAIRFYSLDGGTGSELIREFTGCEGARAVVFTADGQRGLFSCTSSVWVYDVLADAVVHTIEGFDSVLAIATTMDATRAYITSERDGGGDLVVVDLATYGILRTTEVGGFPSTVAVGPDDLRVYVLGSREVRGITVTDKEGVELNFVEPPAFPITFLVVRVPNTA